MPATPSINTTPRASIVLLDQSSTLSESSDYFQRDSWSLHSVQVTNETAGTPVTVKLYASNDATLWTQVGADITSDSVTQLNGFYPYIKVVRDGVTAKYVTVSFSSGNRLRK